MNDHSLPAELTFLRQLIQYRIALLQGIEQEQPVFPQPATWELNMVAFAKQHRLEAEAIILLWIALAPHIKAALFDEAIMDALKEPTDLPVMGGVRGKNARSFLPTGDTVLFLLAGENYQHRFRLHQLFDADHFFAKNRILWLEEVPAGEPITSGRLVLSQEYAELFTTGKLTRPHFSASFPAKLMQTELEWDDLVLSEEIMQQVKELEQWIYHGEVLMNDWGMRDRLKKGYRVLFHGAPGTGKTLTASLLGKYTGRDVYRIDLSMVVSKYIGETEKNLEHLFARAEAKNWILFFDEADALFGKRTGVKEAHDKYANQEVSYLLQRVEDFDGLVILASNMKNNIDDAFIRRFNTIIRFTLPAEDDRALIWKKSFPRHIAFSDGMDIPALVKKYELTGGNIINIVQYACLKALEKDRSSISLDDVLNGIKREMHKEGKPFTINGKTVMPVN
ncbi:AAA family ATPase [Niastella vici]|uniref:AAA family ATPase n=1 Tax=Niastella vici TaxID=1703345 RepID=A0A1V9FQG5_9BACT|nr:ATP-binding protein [Niastella vici]OQP60572.1 AAA family ATPase [Niastella vici]